MAAIAPNSEIRILRNVPLDSTYRNTIYFSDSSSQVIYFASRLKYKLDNQSYQRYQSDIKVNLCADDIYDCNYLMFQNTSFGNKWFYAFITDIEYINNVTSKISYEIDVMQTWLLNCTIHPSFVEREHVVSDEIGEHIITENLELGDYIVAEEIIPTDMLMLKIVIAATFDKNFSDATGGYYGYLYSGLCYNVFDNPNDANTFLTDATNNGKSDQIVSVFMIPEAFIVEKGAAPGTFDLTISKALTDINGYIPKNNKLFTYPYNFLVANNLQGTSATYKYEYFSSESCVFTIGGDMSCTPSAIAFPKNYNNEQIAISEKIAIEAYPQCPYIIDAYRAWVAQHGATTNISLGTSLATLIGGLAALSNPVSAPTGIAMGFKTAQRSSHIFCCRKLSA